MAKYERGVYEPGDGERGFDRDDAQDAEGSRLPLMIVLVLVVLAMFAGLVWLAYNQGVARGRGQTPVLSAANGPVKVAPNQPGGGNAPYQGLKIYEQPAPPDDASPASNNAPAADTAAPPVPAPSGARSTPIVTAPNDGLKLPPQSAGAPPPDKAPAKAEEPKPVPKPVATRPVTPKPAPVKLAVNKVADAPKSMDALIQQAENQSLPATGAPRPLSKPTPPATQPKAGGSAVLQIGAFKSQAEADTAFKAYKAKHPTAARYAEDVVKVDLGAKGTWYRLRLGGFADRDAASATCAKLKTEGGSCMLTK